VLEFSRNEDGRLVARMLRQAMHGVEAATRVYPDPPVPVPAAAGGGASERPASPPPERPSTPSPLDGAASFA
jgi:hypothetical protein